MEEAMTGIERHWKEERRKRMAEFQQRLRELRAEFADLNLLCVDPAGDSVAEIYDYHPGEIVEVRKKAHWSWR